MHLNPLVPTLSNNLIPNLPCIPQCHSYTHRLSCEGPSSQPDVSSIYSSLVSLRDSQTDSTLLLLGMWHFLVMGFTPPERGWGYRATPSFISSHKLVHLSKPLCETHTNTFTHKHRYAEKSTHILVGMHAHIHSHKQKSAHIHKYSMIHTNNKIKTVLCSRMKLNSLLYFGGLC